MPDSRPTRRWGPSDQRRLLAALRKPATEKRHTAQISIHDIIVLEQPRKTFLGVPELADSIALEGLIHAPSIALLSAADFRDYVTINDQLWGSTHDPGQYTPLALDGRVPMYPILIAGERRLRACRSLWVNGCSVCHEEGHDVSPGNCFRRHFGHDQIDVTVYEGIGAIAALNLQYSENTHQPVPLHEEAEAYFLFYRLLRQVMPELTQAAFARQVGRSPDWIRRALAFCDALPDVQDAVRAGHVTYSVALDLHRLSVAGFKVDEVRYRLQHLIVKGKTTKSSDFRRQVTKLIEAHHSGQGSFLEVMTAAQERASWRASFRRILGGSYATHLRAAIEWLVLVTQAADRGELGRTVALGSVRRNHELLVEYLERHNALRLHLFTRRLASRLRKEIAMHYALNEAERKYRRSPRRRP